MRRLEVTNAFKRDFKRIKKNPRHKDIEDILTIVVNNLVEDTPLPHNLFDHSLSGEWSDCRDCHLKPDLILIYRKPNPEILQLVRMGSHSTLGW